MQRWHIYFSGQVQGVGFRYTCCQVAGQFEVTGWVKNLPDRRVEMMVEGLPNVMEAYVNEVRSVTHGRVDDASITKSSATGEFQAMTVRH